MAASAGCPVEPGELAAAIFILEMSHSPIFILEMSHLANQTFLVLPCARLGQQTLSIREAGGSQVHQETPAQAAVVGIMGGLRGDLQPSASLGLHCGVCKHQENAQKAQRLRAGLECGLCVRVCSVQL